MYEDFYGLHERPFELMPDPRYLYLSTHHREALAHLTYGVSEGKDLIQLTGEVGTGKTMMLDTLVRDLDASTHVARLSYTTIEPLDLQRMLAREFGIDGSSKSKAEILTLVARRLEGWAEEGRNALVVVDEAQNLSPQVLEEVRLLSNLRTNGRLGLQIVLAGQPELREKLNEPELRQLKQRIGIQYHLEPLSRAETHGYIEHRMQVAGSSERAFGAGAAGVAYEYSHGVPRMINLLCDRALLAGYAGGHRRISPTLMRRTADELEGGRNAVDAAPTRTPRELSPERTPPGCRWAVPAVVALAVVLVAAGGYLASHGRPKVMREIWPDEPVAGSTRAEGGAEAPILSHGVPMSEVDGPERPELGGEAPEPGGEVPEREASQASHTDGTPVEGPYAVAALSSKSEREAQEEAARLAREGLGATVVPVTLSGQGVWYRVILDERYEKPEDATSLIAALRESGYSDPWVIRR